MKYIEILQNLQKEEPDHIILMKNGIFFIAIGKDAIELNKLIGLQLSSRKKETEDEIIERVKKLGTIS